MTLIETKENLAKAVVSMTIATLNEIKGAAAEFNMNREQILAYIDDVIRTMPELEARMKK